MSDDFQTLDGAALRAALDAVGFELPHGEPESLPAPIRFVEGDAVVDAIPPLEGSLVVLGDLEVEGEIELRRLGALAHLVVTGDLKARAIYADAFVVVGGELSAEVIVADSNYAGGLFLGSVKAETLVLKDIGMEPVGEEDRLPLEVKRLADLEFEEEARVALPEFFEGETRDAFAYFERRVAELAEAGE